MTNSVLKEWPSHIKHIALVGWPGSGKTTVANMLTEIYGGVLVDDGGILRQAASILFDVPIEEFYSAEGKAKIDNVCGRPESRRQMLGELGAYLEERYSPDFMPIRGIHIARKQHVEAPFTIFASVRRDQGRVYQDNSGVVIEIDNPTVSPSPNIWDAWNPDYVDVIIPNDPRRRSLSELREMIVELGDSLANRDDLKP